MNLKVLIIDDSHSYIELLKSKLSSFPFQFDTAFRFEQAEKKLSSKKSIFVRNLFDSVVSKMDDIQKWKESGGVEVPPKLNSKLKKIQEIVNSEGYSLVLVENRTENISRGIDFIKNMVSSIQDFNIDQFILLSSNFKEIKQEASQFSIPYFNKEIRNQLLFKFIQQRTQEIEKRVRQEKTVFEHFEQLRELCFGYYSQKASSRIDKKQSTRGANVKSNRKNPQLSTPNKISGSRIPRDRKQ